MERTTSTDERKEEAISVAGHGASARSADPRYDISESGCGITLSQKEIDGLKLGTADTKELKSYFVREGEEMEENTPHPHEEGHAPVIEFFKDLLTKLAVLALRLIASPIAVFISTVALLAQVALSVATFGIAAAKLCYIGAKKIFSYLTKSRTDESRQIKSPEAKAKPTIISVEGKNPQAFMPQFKCFTPQPGRDTLEGRDSPTEATALKTTTAIG